MAQERHGRAHTLAAALLDVAAHLGDERHARLDVANEFLLDGVEILADGAEDLRQIGGDGGFLRGIAQRCAVFRVPVASE